MKKTILLCLFVIPSLIFAQISEVDSLKLALYNCKTANERCLTLLKISGKYKFIGEYDIARQYSDTTFTMYNQVHDSTKVSIYYNRGSLENFSGNIDTSLYYLNKGIAHAREKHKPKIPHFHLAFGNDFQYLGDYKMALAYFDSAKLGFHARKEFKREALATASLASLNVRVGNYAKSMEQFTEAAQIFEADNQLGNAAKCYLNLSITISRTRDFSRSNNYLYKAIDIFRQLSYKEDMTSCYVNLAVNYLKMNHDSAFACLQKTDSLATAYELRYSQLYTYMNFADYYLRKKQWDSMAVVLSKADRLADELKSGAEQTILKRSWGSYYVGCKQYSKALNQLKQVEKEFLTLGEGREICIFYDELAKAYIGIGDYKNASAYQQLVFQTNDSILNIETTQQISELEIKYKTAKKEQENLRLQSENDLKDAKISQRELVIKGIIIIIILLIISFLQAIRNQNVKAKKKALELFCKRNESSLHSLAGRMGLTLTALTQKVQIPHQSLEELMRIKENVRNISHELRSPDFSSTSFQLSIQTLINDVKNAQIIFHDELPPTSELAHISSFTLQTSYRVIQEAIYNSIKHANATEIWLTISRKNNKLTVAYADNGTGYNPQTIAKNSGYKDMLEAAIALRAKFYDSSAEGIGTDFQFEIPIYFEDLRKIKNIVLEKIGVKYWFLKRSKRA